MNFVKFKPRQCDRELPMEVENAYSAQIPISREKKEDIYSRLKYIHPLFHPFYYSLIDGDIAEEDPDIELKEIQEGNGIETPSTPCTPKTH